jgi:hypothetical protein
MDKPHKTQNMAEINLKDPRKQRIFCVHEL